MDVVKESVFTSATSICPHPEYWTASDDASTEIEVSELLSGLIRGLQPDFCIETGTAWGQSAESIGIALQKNGHGKLVSLEVDKECVDFSKARCKGLPVDILCMSSTEYTPNTTIDFLFLDSTFPLRVDEFKNFKKWMRVGSIVVFHDTAPLHGGGQLPYGRDLRLHIEKELSGYMRLLHLPTPRGLTIGWLNG